MITGIPCPECNSRISYESLCDCEHPEDCLIEYHEYFYCRRCKEEKDVSFDDEIYFKKLNKITITAQHVSQSPPRQV